MFTPENFRRVFDSENRKGFDVGGRFFPHLQPHTTSIRNKTKEIRDLRSQETTIGADEFSSKVTALKKELKELKSKKSAEINSSLEQVSSNVLKSNFTLSLEQRIGPKGKPIYHTDGSPESFFVVKQLQYNIRKIYKVKQSNRNDLVCQLRDCLQSRFPFCVVRTDVSSFYESIDRSRLIAKIDEDNLLTYSTKKYIRQILNEYGRLSGSPTGIPRGVGISAYLAELYFRPIDSKIQSLSRLVLYCRFVDDIVAVFARPHFGKQIGSYADLIATKLSEFGLKSNPEKTVEFTVGGPKRQKIEYLGYRFVLKDGECRIWPSAAKIRKYKARIKAAFAQYNVQSSLRSRRAFRDLVARVKFLTDNARLWNSRSTALTGVYYNNPIVTEKSSFALLDRRLKSFVKSVPRPTLRKRLKKYTFTTGFEERRFHNFSPKELQTIVRAWKHE